MESEMISMENVKPILPTPRHLRIYKISLLDQVIPCVYIPVILYWCSDGGDRIQLLKESLSQTLVTFYPFAGVIRDALSADCNDQGIPFSVAKVKGQMSDFLQNPNIQLINNFLPDEYNPWKPLGPGANVMLIQLNSFDCGGVAMSITFAHFVADLTSISTFLRCWGANARGGFAQGSRLNCIAQSSFPQKDSLPMNLVPSYSLMKFVSVGKFVTRRYVFDASALCILKEELSSSSPSRVDVVTAVIWKCFMAAVAEESTGKDVKPFLLNQAVNLRRRAVPPFPDDSFGNFVWVASAVCNNHDGKELREVVREVKQGRARIDEGFVRRLERDDDDDLYEYLGELRNEMPQETKLLCITSWANMGLYEVDFGWGKPVWLSGIVSRNSESETRLPSVVTLMDTRARDGIEAWMILDQNYVAGFEKNDEIQKYARVNPSVL